MNRKMRHKMGLPKKKPPKVRRQNSHWHNLWRKARRPSSFWGDPKAWRSIAIEELLAKMREAALRTVYWPIAVALVPKQIGNPDADLMCGIAVSSR